MLILLSLFSNAQYQVIVKKDLNSDTYQDMVYKDSITNKLVFEYAKHNKKNDTISFFSNYKTESGSVHIDVIKNSIRIKFTYAPKYLDFDVLNFSYDKIKTDWFFNGYFKFTNKSFK